MNGAYTFSIPCEPVTSIKYARSACTKSCEKSGPRSLTKRSQESGNSWAPSTPLNMHTDLAWEPTRNCYKL